MSGFSRQLVEDAGTIDRLRIDIGSGLVEIVPNDGSETVVSLDVDGGSEDEVVFEVTDGALIVEAPRTFRRGPEIRVRIATPATIDARIKTGSGEISARTPLGTTRLSTGSGDIALDRVEGDLAATTGSGDIRAEHVAGTVRAGTGSGTIDIAEAGDGIGLTTGSGTVRVGEVAGPARVKVGSGDITIERIRDHSIATSGSGDVRIQLADAPSIQAETARGDVHIGVPAGVPTYLDLKTVTGRIKCELEPREQPAEGDRTLVLRARTVSGDISVSRA